MDILFYLWPHCDVILQGITTKFQHDTHNIGNQVCVYQVSCFYASALRRYCEEENGGKNMSLSGWRVVRRPSGRRVNGIRLTVNGKRVWTYLHVCRGRCSIDWWSDAWAARLYIGPADSSLDLVEGGSYIWMRPSWVQRPVSAEIYYIPTAVYTMWRPYIAIYDPK